MAAALAVGFLFDQGRIDVLKARELDHLRLHAERATGELSRYVQNLRRDTLFLAGTPPIPGVARALSSDGYDPLGKSTLDQWRDRLEQIFLSFGETRPEYFQLRLIGIHDGGRELVRVERTAEGLHATPEEELQRKGSRYYFREAAALPRGVIRLSRIDLNRENQRLSVPYQPTLRASTAVYDDQHRVFGVVVVNMDMRKVFERVESYLDPRERLYILDQQGQFLVHPDPERTFSRELGKPRALPDFFRQLMAQVDRVAEGTGALVADGRGVKGSAVYANVRSFAGQEPADRLAILVEERAEELFRNLGIMQRDSLLIMAGLLVLAIVLVVMISRRMTGSLRALALAADKVASGQYQADFPHVGSAEIGQLANALRHMVTEVERREHELSELNKDLERRVEERTREIADQRALQDLIIENIGDGLVVTDCDGRFLLWNRKASQIVGAGPDDVAPERWSKHFGVFRNAGGDPVPAEELPLVRAMHGIPSDNVELFLQHPEKAEGHWVQVTGRPLRDADGNLVGGIAAMLDVTAQKRLQARVETHRAELQRVGRLVLTAEIAASAADSLSQPIAALESYAHTALRLQRDGRLNAEQLVAILEEIERLSAQSGHALDRVRALIQRRNQPPEPVDVNAVAASCIDGVKGRIQHLGARFVANYEDGLPVLYGDPIELEQALAQLVDNALDALRDSPLQRRQLYLTTSHDAEGDQVVIQIEDTGPGVSQGLVQQLFEPWEPGRTGGVGLGLKIAQTIVESFQGRIRYEAGPRGGAIFRVELPVNLEDTM